MTLLQWAFSFKGRIGRRPFWAGIASCFILVTLISLLQNAFSIPDAVIVVLFILLLYPLAAIFTKRLHDRGKPGGWFALIVLAFALYSIDVSQLADIWQWGIGRFPSTVDYDDYVD
ncbi:Predicted membrane protein [Providencia alcalifaciens]|nr:Predicted membrane protein [Providencia alcalifaciens]